MSTFLFQDVERVNRPLSQMLSAHLCELAARGLYQIMAEELDGRSDRDVAAALLAAHWNPPRLGAVEVVGHCRGAEFCRPGSGPGSWWVVPSRRFQLRWAVGGDGEWLTFWPDCDEALVAVDRLLDDEEAGQNVPGEEWNRRLELKKRFKLVDGKVRSFVDIPHEDDTPLPPAEMRERAIESEHALLVNFADAVDRCARNCRGDIENLIMGMVAAYRRKVTWERDVVDGLVLAMDPPRLELREPPSGPLELPPRRLVEASVLNLLGAVEAWSRKVQVYPASYAKLSEDNLSDLLAVTLAVAFGFADREVFCRGGKTDISVPVAAIREMSGEVSSPSDGTAWVAEAKKGSGPALAKDALAQLSGYIPVAAPDAALLFYVVAGNLAAVKDRMLEALRGRPEHVGPGSVPGSPYEHLLFRDPDTGFDTSVAIIFIHLRAPNRTRRESGRTRKN